MRKNVVFFQKFAKLTLLGAFIDAVNSLTFEQEGTYC